MDCYLCKGERSVQLEILGNVERIPCPECNMEELIYEARRAEEIVKDLQVPC